MSRLATVHPQWLRVVYHYCEHRDRSGRGRDRHEPGFDSSHIRLDGVYRGAGIIEGRLHDGMILHYSSVKNGQIRGATVYYLRPELELDHLSGIHFQVVRGKCQGSILAHLDDVDFNLTSSLRLDRGGEK